MSIAAEQLVYASAARRTVRLIILERDGYRCTLHLDGCTGTATCVDHIVSILQGGHPFDEANRGALVRIATVFARIRRALDAIATNLERPTVERVGMTNTEAARTTIAALTDTGRIEKVDTALVALVEALATALDADPTNARLARQYREALAEVTRRDDDKERTDRNDSPRMIRPAASRIRLASSFTMALWRVVWLKARGPP